MKHLLLSITKYIIAEYIWIDSNNKLRSKSKTLYIKNYTDCGCNSINIKDLPNWNFDGSSTGQASSNNSEVILKPVSIFQDPFKKDYGILVLCECYNTNMKHIKSNYRYESNKIFESIKEYKPWFGLEQEYVLYNNKTNKLLGWPTDDEPDPQGNYYCGLGSNNICGRHIVEKHYKKCLDIGLKVSGINAEVMLGQWEFQIGPVEGIDACDQLWVARYILEKICEEYNVYVSYDPKPIKGESWNGSGCHVNYSTIGTRSKDGINIIYSYIDKLSKCHEEHIKVYGNNNERLIGKLETSSINKFTYGVADRTASIRIPYDVNNNGKGYLEDRRPASDIDPYIVLSKLVKTTLID